MQSQSQQQQYQAEEPEESDNSVEEGFDEEDERPNYDKRDEHGDGLVAKGAESSDEDGFTL